MKTTKAESFEVVDAADREVLFTRKLRVLLQGMLDRLENAEVNERAAQAAISRIKKLDDEASQRLFLDLCKDYVFLGMLAQTTSDLATFKMGASVQACAHPSVSDTFVKESGILDEPPPPLPIPAEQCN